MYGLPEQDLAIQARARAFADELIPFEEQAEASGGDLPADVAAGQAKRARELRLHSTSMTRASPAWRRKYAHHAPTVPPPTTTASAVLIGIPCYWHTHLGNPG